MNVSTDISKNLKINPLLDISLWFLFFVNLFTIFLAISQSWKLTTLMWIYWFQSIIIGFFNFVRILQLKEFTTDGYKVNGIQPPTTTITKIFTAFFFLFHFGGFHFVYLLFLIALSMGKIFGDTLRLDEFLWILITSVMFCINHLFSYFYNKSIDNQKPNIGALMFYPYARVLPIHLTIVGFGFIFQNSLLFFLILKTFADCIMHIIEHKYLRSNTKTNT